MRYAPSHRSPATSAITDGFVARLPSPIPPSTSRTTDSGMRAGAPVGGSSAPSSVSGGFPRADRTSARYQMEHTMDNQRNEEQAL